MEATTIKLEELKAESLDNQSIYNDKQSRKMADKMKKE
jgi:hypothetical protein